MSLSLHHLKRQEGRRSDAPTSIIGALGPRAAAGQDEQGYQRDEPGRGPAADFRPEPLARREVLLRGEDLPMLFCAVEMNTRALHSKTHHQNQPDSIIRH